jgi:hypothetical protein
MTRPRTTFSSSRQKKRTASNTSTQPEENKMKFVTAAAAAALTLAIAGPAAAVTVKNTSAGEFTIGVDLGNEEKVETIAAGKEVKVECKEGCGVTGPWGFSWMAKPGDTISSNGQALVTVQEPAAKK